jgi:hypothetical protein
MKTQYLSREYCKEEIIKMFGADFCDSEELTDSEYAEAMLDCKRIISEPSENCDF